MAITQQIRTRNYNQNLIRYLLRTVWERKIWFLVAMVIGAVLATLVVYLNPPKYLAKATFLADLPIVSRQVESMGSRDLLLRSLDKLHHVKVQCYTKETFGRKADFYDQTPVAIQVRSLPEHLRNVEMKLEFADDAQYTLFFEAFGEKVSASSRFGSMLSIGSIQMLIEPTRFWSERYTNGTVFFQVHSLEQVAAQSMGNYRVENVMHRKNRIAVYYSDDNPDRAYDILKAVTEEALIGYQRDIDVLIESRIGRIRSQMDVLLEKMIGDENLGSLLQGERFATENKQIDSMVVVLQTLDSQTARLNRRDSMLQALKATLFVGEQFWEEFLFDAATAEDSVLLRLMATQKQMRLDSDASQDALRELNLSIDQSVRLIMSSDSIVHNQIRSRKVELEDRLMTDIQLRKSIISNAIDRRDRSNIGILNWEAYLINANEKYQAEQETSENEHYFNLIESPYVINPSRRLVQVKQVVSGALAGAVLMLGFVLLSMFGSGKIRSTQHLQLVGSLPLQALISEKKVENAVRSIQVAVEMERKPEEKVLSIVASHDDDRFHQLVNQLTARYNSLGLKVHLFSNFPPSETADSPESELSVHMLSRDRQNRLSAAIEEYDLVIQHLPALRTYPESWYLGIKHRHLIYMVTEGATTYSEIKEVESMMEKNDLKVYMYFNGR